MGTTERRLDKTGMPRNGAHSAIRAKLPVALAALCWLIVGTSASVVQANVLPTRATHDMVASSEPIASRVGVEILKRGGNAIDAAVATGLALAVTYPYAGNLGGGGFMLIRLANGKATAIDYRETAPASASYNMYLDAKGNVIPDASLIGYRASGVPGTVAGLALAQSKYGKLKWRDVVEPARKLASEGFVVSDRLAAGLRGEAKLLSRFPETNRIFLRNGRFYVAGERLRQPDLGATLKRIQENGPREFYEGRTARDLASDMASHGGNITLADLQAYHAVERVPLRGTYRGYEIVTMPPPSSGGIALLEMLNILERYDLRYWGFNSARTDHYLVEAMRRAFADRAQFLGDPDFVSVPVASLISKTYARTRRATIDDLRATSSIEIGHGDPAPKEASETTHFSVVDAEGNAASNTYTLNAAYGSGVTIAGAGFLMNNEMDDFASKPGVPNAYGLIQGEANAIAPRKRPLSSMTPTIVTQNGKLRLVIGSPGGPTIINTVLQVIVNTIDHDMNIAEAIAAPRIHHQWLPDAIRTERFGMSSDTITALKALKHRFPEKPDNGTIGDAQGIAVDAKTGERQGASDPRGGGQAIGY